MNHAEIANSSGSRQDPKNQFTKQPFVGARRGLRLLFSLALSAAMLIGLFHLIDGKEVLAAFSCTTAWGWLVLALILSAGSNLLLAAWQWWKIVRGLGYRVRYRTLLYLIMATDPMTTLVPFRGGELIRAWYQAKWGKMPLDAATGSIAIELGMNVVAFFLVWLVGIVGWATSSVAIGFIVPTILCLALILGIVKLAHMMAKKLETGSESALLARFVRQAFTALGRMSFSSVLSSSLAAFACQFIEFVSIAIIFHAFSIDLDLVMILALVPAATLAGRLPVSFGGIGLRETSLVFVLQGFTDTPSAVVLAVGLTYTLVETLFPALLGLPLTIHLLARGKDWKNHTA